MEGRIGIGIAFLTDIEVDLSTAYSSAKLLGSKLSAARLQQR